MRKLFAGAAAAALLTVGVAGVTNAQDLTVGPIGTPAIFGEDAFVFNPPAGGGVGFLVTVDGAPSSFLVDNGGLTVDFGVGGLTGASIYTPLGEVVNAPRS